MKQNINSLRPACAHAGFTLIELMLGITLLGVLLALAMPSFNAVLQRYRVSTAAHQIANALQFARAEAVRTRNNVTVGQAAPSAECTSGTPANWSCGVDVYATAGTPLKTIPASSLHAVNVQIVSSHATGTTLAYSPMGYGNTKGVDSFIYVWPAAQGGDFTTASILYTVCATSAGKVRTVASYVTSSADCTID